MMLLILFIIAHNRTLAVAGVAFAIMFCIGVKY